MTATDDHGFERPEQKYVVFMVFLMLLVGAATRHLLTRYFPKLPYSVVLLSIGYGFGFIMPKTTETLKYAEIAEIDPHLLLMVFLPILLFESTFTIEYHIFRKSIYAILWLAVPGVILATLLTAVWVKYTIPEEWSWLLVLLFGSIVSATDPVAVVALLRELGASKALATLIEGESLLNDGTAIVIFSQILKAYRNNRDNNGDIEIGDIFQSFFYTISSAPLVGVFCGYVTTKWLSVIHNDMMVEVTVVLGTVYFVYYISEQFAHTSGVLAVVTFGLYLNAVGRSRITPKVVEFLHHFYETIAYLANTIIFLLVGYIAAIYTSHVSMIEYAYLLNIYVGVHLIRATIVLLLGPLLRRTGYGLNWRESFILIVSGLRGSVALALGLVVSVEVPNDEISNRLLFQIAGLVVLTLVINGIFVRKILQWLGMSDMAPSKIDTLARASAHLAEVTELRLESMHQDPYIAEADWNIVREYQFNATKYFQITTTGHHSVLRSFQLKNAQLDGKHRMLSFMLKNYWHQHEMGWLSQNAVLILSEITEEVRDSNVVDRWPGENELASYLYVPQWIQKIQFFVKWPLIGSLCNEQLFNHLLTSFHVSYGYIRAVEDCIHAAEQNSVQFFGNENVGKMLIKLAQDHKHRIITLITNIKDIYPEVSASVRTVQATQQLLSHQLQSVIALKQTGVLEEDECIRFTNGIEKCVKRLLFAPPNVSVGTTASLLNQQPFFRTLTDPMRESLARFCRETFHPKGTRIISNDTKIDTVYIVVRGYINCQFIGKMPTHEGRGYAFGEVGLLTPPIDAKLYTPNVIAETDVRILRVPYGSLRVIFKRHPQCFESLWKSVAVKIAVPFFSTMKPYSSASRSILKIWATRAKCLVFKDEDCAHPKLRRIDYIAIVIYGSVATRKETGEGWHRYFGTFEHPVLLHGPCLYKPIDSPVLLEIDSIFNERRPSVHPLKSNLPPQQSQQQLQQRRQRQSLFLAANHHHHHNNNHIGVGFNSMDTRRFTEPPALLNHELTIVVSPSNDGRDTLRAELNSMNTSSEPPSPSPLEMNMLPNVLNSGDDVDDDNNNNNNTNVTIAG